MTILCAYLQTWILKLSHAKTETAAFYLYSREAKRELKVYCITPRRPSAQAHLLWSQTVLNLTYCPRLEALPKNQSSCVSLLRRLAGSGWGTRAKTLCTSLFYSTAEYCTLVWCRSALTRPIDSELNDFLRIVIRCLHPTPTEYLSVVLDIYPAEFCRH